MDKQHVSQISPEKQNSWDIIIFFDREGQSGRQTLVSRSWFTRVWGLASLKSVWQTGRLETDRSWCCSLEADLLPKGNLSFLLLAFQLFRWSPHVIQVIFFTSHQLIIKVKTHLQNTFAATSGVVFGSWERRHSQLTHGTSHPTWLLVSLPH